VLFFGLCAVASTLRGFRFQSKWWLMLGLFFSMCACGINFSGVWSLGALGLTGIVLRWRHWNRADLGYLTVLGFVFLVTCWVYLVVFQHDFSPRELVQNPDGGTTGRDLTQISGLQILKMSLILPAALGGAILGLLVPTFAQFFVAQATENMSVWVGFLLVELVVVGLLGRYVIYNWIKVSGNGRRYIMIALGVALAGLCLPLLGRKEYALSVPTTLWHAKYMAMPTTWLMILVALWMNESWIKTTFSLRQLTQKMVLVLAAGIWLFSSHHLWEKTLLNQPLAYTARGRWGNVENALLRRQQYQEVMSTLSRLSSSNGSGRAMLPSPTWGADFFQLYPLLEWGSDYTARGVTHLFADMPAASPQLDLWVEYVPLSSLSSDKLHLFKSIPWLVSIFPDLSENHLPE
jgi:hypothetical protein